MHEFFVIGKFASLSECLLAAIDVTDIRLSVEVYVLMLLQVLLEAEACLTLRALEGLQVHMFEHVTLEGEFGGKNLVAVPNIAHKLLFSSHSS